MRETAGSAAAPAARCKNVRRGSFILNLPSRHSITSSARASTLAGTSRPSAFAVLRLITVSYLVGACTGRSAGFSPLRMRPDATRLSQSGHYQTRLNILFRVEKFDKRPAKPAKRRVMVVALVPINANVIGRDRNRQRQHLDRHVGHECFC